MTQKFHISYRLPNGAIVGIGGENVADLRQNLTDLFGSGDTAMDLIALMQHGLISAMPSEMPGAEQAGANLQAAFPGGTPMATAPDQWAGFGPTSSTPPWQQQAPAQPAPVAAPPQQWQQPQQQYQQPVAPMAPQPPQQREQAGPPPGPIPTCPQHNWPAKWVNGGIAKSGPRQGQPYPGFWACAHNDRNCKPGK